MMNLFRLRRIIFILCLAGCLAVKGERGMLRVCHAGQEQADAAVQEAGGEEKPVMADSVSAACLVIDNQNVYEGMETSYAEGYVPKVEKDKAVIVLPLLSGKKLANNQVTVSVTFGGAENIPFVYKNYEKTVSFGYYMTQQKAEKTGCYLISFALELKKERYNGSYPVTLSVDGVDEAGNEIRQEFTVYVTVTDGKTNGDGIQGASGAGEETGFTIDNKHVYPGMEKSYAKGYVPKIKGNEAVVVLPLLAKQKLAENRMTVSLSFGESDNQPFVRNNTEKTVKLTSHKVNGKKKSQQCYLSVFHLKLKKERYNGSYPVIFSVRAQDKTGNEIHQEFTVYVTITDGKEAGEEAETDDADDNTPRFAPKVMLESYHFSKETVLCGEQFTAELTLRNTSRTDEVKNMLVSVVPGENVELLSEAASGYVEELGAGSTCTVSFAFCVNATASRGQYNIGVTMDYADSRGNPYTLQGTMKVMAEQQVQIEIAPVSVPDKIQMGETVELQAQAMNLGKGKLYNVRAVVEAEGLTSSGTAFIGDMEAGTSMVGSMELTAEGLSGDTLYGTTQGKIIFLYEDEAGNEMTQEQSFEMSILSPLSGSGDDAPEDDTTQWWIIMIVITVFIVEAAAILLMRRSRHVQMKEGEGV